MCYATFNGKAGGRVLARLSSVLTLRRLAQREALQKLSMKLDESRCVTVIDDERKGFRMAVEVADIIRIVAKLKLNGVNDIVNVYHFVVAVNTLLNDDEVMDGVASILDTLYTKINLVMTNNVTYDGIDGVNVTKTELLPPKAWPILTVGANVNSMLPEMSAACVFFRTLKPNVRCSKFLPPFTEEANVDGAVQAGAVTAVGLFGDFLVAPLTVAGLELGYVSFNRVTSVATQVLTRVVPPRYRTQRRRRIGVGS